jgi:hypothetical protein
MEWRVDVDFTADNPGRWLLHCRHAYHIETGMIRLVEVTWALTRSTSFLLEQLVYPAVHKLWRKRELAGNWLTARQARG